MEGAGVETGVYVSTVACVQRTKVTSVGRFKNHWARAVTETRYGVLRDKQGGP